MSFSSRILTFFFFLGLFGSLSAQRIQAHIDSPKFDSLPSPNINVVKSKNFRPKDWLEVEVRFELKSEDRKQDFADKVTIRWYVVIENPDKRDRKNKYVLIQKEVEHVNVPIGEPIYASVYLSPTAIKRLTGRERASRSTIDRVGGEILIDGNPAYRKSGLFSSKGNPGWWESQSLTAYDKVSLLHKNETPFKFLWWDRYAEIAPQK